MRRYLLDTDAARYLIRGQTPVLDEWISGMASESICISAITRGELLYGMQLKAGAHRLARVVDEFLERVACLPWDASAATHFRW